MAAPMNPPARPPIAPLITPAAGKPHPHSHGHPPGTAEPPRPARRVWPVLRRVLTFAFFAAVVWLLVEQAQRIEWHEVGTAMRELPALNLALAALLALASHTLYSTYDLIGRHETGHKLSTRQVMGVTSISYAFNLNMGSLIGGVGFRYRMYSRLGLRNRTITRVLSLSLLTNWLGYLLLAGGVFLVSPLALPEGWRIDEGALRALGGVLVALWAAYLIACATAKRRTWSIRGHEIELPMLRVALLQTGLSTLNWMLIAGTVYLLLQQRIDYPTVLAVMLIAAVAGVVTHVPAGLGVLEAVFVALLSHRLSEGALLGGLLAYRGLYYLAPLVIATFGFVVFEARAKRAGAARRQQR